jgi:hypothetical protein
MSLRYIVPTLGILACTAGVTQAAEIGGGVTLNGYVDTVLEITSAQDNAIGLANSGSTVVPAGETEASNTIVDFSAAAQLEIGYTIGDVSANVELYLMDDDTIDLEQAYVKWDVKPGQAYVKMGLMETGLGFEANDAPGLYRVNVSQLGFFQPQQTAGVTVGFKANDMFSGAVTLCDNILPEGTLMAKGNADLAILLQGMFNVEGVGEFKAEFGYDMGAGMDDVGEQDDAMVVDLSGLITAMKDSNMVFGFDINYWSLGEISTMGFLAMANYKFTTDTPMAATLMVDYVDIDMGDISDDDDTTIEIAVALLTQPTKEENVGLNVEFRYIMRDQTLGGADVDDIDEFGIFVELLAVIP